MRKTVLLSLLGAWLGMQPLAAQDKKKVALEDIARFYSFSPESVEGFHSMNDGEHYTLLQRSPNEGGAIRKFAYSTGELVTTIITTNEMEAKSGRKVAVRSYAFSPDESKLLIPTETEPIYRHSTKSKYLVYDLKTGQMQDLSAGKQQYASFNPVGDQVAYVEDNNLFYKDLKTGESVQVTTDGKRNFIINGATDWVYEEEFGFDQAFFWSPDGKYIAYYRFDESDVRTFSMDVFGKELYPTQDVFKYPKAGEDNAKVTIHIYDVAAKVSRLAAIPFDFEYVPRIKWTVQANQLCVFVMNRHQNHLRLLQTDAGTGASKLWFEEKDVAYLDITDDIVFLKDNSFIWTSERNGYNHLYHVDAKGRIKQQITNGKFDVASFYGINTESNTLYYQAAETGPQDRQVFSIGLNGKGKKLLTPGAGTHTAKFNTGFKYFAHTHSKSFAPPVTTLRTAKGAMVRTLQDNQRLNGRLQQYELATKEFFTLKGAAGDDLPAWIIKPTDFNPALKYPVLMFVYGGPGSQTVKNSYDAFNDFWYQHLASLGYIIVSVDNRGTGFKGKEFKKNTYLQLGKNESDDQIAAAQALAAMPFVDGTRIGIWGWSYGGYMSALCLAKGNAVFKMAMAVAPVTNWRFYDSIYTERYMRTPQENASGYDDNSPINHTQKIKGKLLLVHGTADDNVHVQNSMVMTESLVTNDVQFQQFMYPDKNHGIYGGNTRFHLYKMMTAFVMQNL